MKRIFLALVASVLLLSAFTGCGQSSTSKATINKPQRIISLTLGVDEILVSLVDKSRITALSKVSVDPGVSNIVDIAKDIPLLSNSQIEQIIANTPDIVFVPDWEKKELSDQLKGAGINVQVIKTPSTIAEVREAVTNIANAVGEQQKGADIIKWMDDKLSQVDEKVKTIKESDKKVALEYNSFLSTSGTGTTFDEIITRAGIINGAAKAGLEKWPAISKEFIVQCDPDIMFLPSWAYEGTTDPNAFAKSVREDASLSHVKAVVNNKLLMLPNNHISSVSQYMVLAIEDAAKAAYPEIFK